MTPKSFVIAIVGPTASGKSELAVEIAKKVNGEVISADSRQVYRGMDIGTGKVEGRWRGGKYFYKSIRHYGIDIANPRTQYSAAKFQSYAKKAIAEILAQGKVPILCGGTGHWIDAVLFDQTIPTVKPNTALRKKLAKLSATELFAQLKQLDPKRAKNIDAKNPRRLIRALEIVLSTGKPVPVSKPKLKYDVLWLGVTHNKETLNKRIDKRLNERIKSGMITEVKKLRTSGLSWKKLEAFGLEYKFVSLFLQKKFTKNEMRSLLSTAIKQYAKRQMTWFKRNKDIHWIGKASEALKIIK